MKGLEQVAAHLDNVIGFESERTAHVETLRACLERLRKHNLKLSLSKVRDGAREADFLGHSISPSGARPSADEVSILIKCSCHGIQSRSAPRWAVCDAIVKCCVTCPRNVHARHGGIEREMTAELATPPILV